LRPCGSCVLAVASQQSWSGKPAELERSGAENEPYFHSFFGAKNEPRNIFFIHSLAQRTNQETSTPYQTTPYMGCLNQEVAEADDFLWVLVSRDTRWVSFAAAFIFRRTL
jgi:hypothetical protein